jgi:hypothetical protein
MCREFNIICIDCCSTRSHGGISGFGDLSISQNGLDVVINHGGNNEVTLQNTSILDIDATDFVF